MAKYFNNQKKTGKLAGSVFAIRHGETIERAYNPIVANPKSQAQTGARARFKLMSQLSAVMAGIIAIPRNGAVSPRNGFVKANYGATSYDGTRASVDLTTVTLTASIHSLPGLGATRTSGTLAVGLSARPSSELDGVVYIIFDRATNGLLHKTTEVVVTEPGADNSFGADINIGSLTTELIVYAYGYTVKDETLRQRYNSYNVITATLIAELAVVASSTNEGMVVTETRARIVPAQA